MLRLWILGIVILAFILRLMGLSSYPSGLTPDEASFGYDAYSLLETGKDQWGNAFPSTFKSFGDYKLPVYTYLTMPSVAAFGLNKFSVRLPNAILGSLAVAFTCFLAAQLVDNRHRLERFIPLLSGVFLSVSYWHIALSRGAFEANLTTFFMTAGAYFFLRARKNHWFLSLAMLFFGLNLFTYHAARLVTPVIVISLLWIYRNDFPRKKKYTLASAIFLFFFLASIVSLFAGSGIRAATSTIATQNLGSGNLRASIVNSGMPMALGRVFYNEPLFKVGKLIQNYFSYFSPAFLFTEGAREASYGMIPGVGVLSIIEFVGLPFFVWLSLKKRTPALTFLVIWILAAPIPASISVGPGNAANRAVILLPALQIASAIGIIYAISFVRLNMQKSAVVGVIFTSLIIGILGYTRYLYEQPVYASNGMMYGMRELFGFLRQYPTKHVILSRSLSEAHIYAAFYDPIYPPLFQKATRAWNFQEKGLFWVDQQEGYFVGRYTINSIDKIRDFQYNDTFVVGTPDEMPTTARIIKTILTADLKPLWVVAEKQ